MTSTRTGLVTRNAQRVAADPSRVITRLFVPGQEGFEHQESRAGVVLARVLALSDEDVRSALDDVITRFDGRHRDLAGTFRRHAHELADRPDPDREISDARMLLAANRLLPGVGMHTLTRLIMGIPRFGALRGGCGGCAGGQPRALCDDAVAIYV